jgi:hypothetical protein
MMIYEFSSYKEIEREKQIPKFRDKLLMWNKCKFENKTSKRSKLIHETYQNILKPSIFPYIN